MRAFLLTILFSCALALGLAPAALALSPLDPLATDLMDLHATDIADGNFNLNADGNSVNVIVGQVIKVFLGLFATIFIVLTLMAGFKYMTSRGDSKKVGEALESIRYAVIGLVITLGTYIITYFVFLAVPGSA